MRDAVLAFVLHGEAGIGLQDRVHRRTFGERARLAEARDRQIDDARFALGDRGVAEAQAIDHAGPEALQEHVGTVDQAPQDGAAILLLQVERDGALAEVGGQRIGALVAIHHAEIACPVADAGRLDLDDVGAILCEQHGAIGTGDALAHVDHLQAGEWLVVAHGGGAAACGMGGRVAGMGRYCEDACCAWLVLVRDLYVVQISDAEVPRETLLGWGRSWWCVGPGSLG